MLQVSNRQKLTGVVCRFGHIRGLYAWGRQVCRRGCIGRNTEFGNRVNQVDLRVTKGVRFGRYRVEAIADFYNAFNVAPILTHTTTYGPTWLTPASILQSGFVKLGGRFTF